MRRRLTCKHGGCGHRQVLLTIQPTICARCDRVAHWQIDTLPDAPPRTYRLTRDDKPFLRSYNIRPD